MEEQKLRQLFKNRSNCYVDTDDVVQGMDEDCFVETVNEALRKPAVMGSGYLCSIEGIKVFVIADNIADCMDKLEKIAEGQKYQVEIHKSIEVSHYY